MSSLIGRRLAVPQQQHKVLFGTVMHVSSDGELVTVLYDDGSSTDSFPMKQLDEHTTMALRNATLDNFGPYLDPMKNAFLENRDNAFVIWTLSDLSDIDPPGNAKARDFFGLSIALEKDNGKSEFAKVVSCTKVRKNAVTPRGYKFTVSNSKGERSELSYMEMLSGMRSMTKHRVSFFSRRETRSTAFASSSPTSSAGEKRGFASVSTSPQDTAANKKTKSMSDEDQLAEIRKKLAEADTRIKKAEETANKAELLLADAAQQHLEKINSLEEQLQILKQHQEKYLHQPEVATVGGTSSASVSMPEYASVEQCVDPAADLLKQHTGQQESRQKQEDSMAGVMARLASVEERLTNQDAKHVVREKSDAKHVVLPMTEDEVYGRLYPIKGCKKPEPWKNVRLVAPRVGGTNWGNKDAVCAWCTICKTAIPYTESNNRAVPRHHKQFHETKSGENSPKGNAGSYGSGSSSPYFPHGYHPVQPPPPQGFSGTAAGYPYPPQYPPPYPPRGSW